MQTEQVLGQIRYSYPLYPWERDWSQIFTYQWHLCDHGEFNTDWFRPGATGEINTKGHTFGPPDVVKTLSQIAAVDKVTRGIPKVIELCGWQRYWRDQPYAPENHVATWDCRFPSFTDTDPAFCHEGLYDPLGKSDPAADPNAAIRWLMEEAKKHNTMVTFHVNFQSCNTKSSMWHTYHDAGALIKKNGLVQMGVSHHDGGYVNLKAEWGAGLFHERIGYDDR